MSLVTGTGNGSAVTQRRAAAVHPIVAGIFIATCVAAPQTLAAEIYSAHVDREGQRILVRGVDLDQAGGVTLGGVAVPFASSDPSELEIPFGTEVYDAIQWEASYNLVIDGTLRISVYIDGPIAAPPPPPEPPSGGPDCPCTAGWGASGIPKDNFTWCLWGQDGDQLWIYGNRDQYTISAAYDPTNIFFDPVDPGNSVSYCVLIESGSYTVAEPVTNINQYHDCEGWMFRKVCI